jgi:hypothetical protein
MITVDVDHDRRVLSAWTSGGDHEIDLSQFDGYALYHNGVYVILLGGWVKELPVYVLSEQDSVNRG